MFKNLSTYIELLEREGELVRIGASVDPVLEIAEITDRVSKVGGKALLFENTGTDFPVVTNLFGSPRRIATALGAGSIGEISARLDGILRQAFVPRGSLAEKAGALPLLARMSRWFPVRTKGRGECGQVVLEGGLEKLPILKCWPCDGGRFITLPLVHTLDPETGGRNLGMYRMQVFDDRTTGMHWHVHKTGARHYEAYKRLGVKRMPVSVCLGGDPVYTYAATAPMPDGMDEYLLAGFLRDRPVKLVKCLTNDIYVPSDCDFVIEGYIDTTEPPRTEGPFGDHTGFYSLEDDYPVFHVEAITHRRGAIYPATVVGIPPQEDAYFAEATERVFLPPIRRALQPEVRDLYMPPAGVAHNLAVVSLETSYPGQAVKVAGALWGAGQMMFCKVLVAVPAEIDVRDREAVLGLLRGLDPRRDLHFAHGVADVLDHATATPGMGSKLLIDLTCTHSDLSSPPYPPRGGDASLPQQTRFIFDETAAELTFDEKLWLGLANLDPVRDIRVDGHRITVDCRAKLPGSAGAPARWPNVVASSPATIALVDRRRAEYGLGECMPSPSERYRKLLLSDDAEA